jgi:uncharacterized membrane protein
LAKLLFMGNLSAIGRIFYGVSMAAMGFLTIYYRDFPYMMIPPHHGWTRGVAVVAYISGAALLVGGVCIALGKRTMRVSLLLGIALLLVFCFYFLPYELLTSPNSMHFGDWENAAKELALAAGALVLAGRKLTPLGIILYSLTIISFSMVHFMYAKEAADYVPSWIPNPVFWIYFAGVALFGSGIGILLNIRRTLMATLLGAMILIWVIILHIPKSIAAPAAERGGEVVSAFLALAYCGIAFVIAGIPKQKAPPAGWGQ